MVSIPNRKPNDLRARRPERQQQVDQVQHVRHAVVVDVLARVTGRSGRLPEAQQQVDQVEDVDGASLGARPEVRGHRRRVLSVDHAVPS